MPFLRTMKDFYLSETTREYYSKALAHIRNCGDEFWDLDPDLDKYIDLVNLSPNVRTMYSKRGRGTFGNGLGSYLTVCYAKEVESQILNEINSKLKTTFETKRWCEFLSQLRQPKIEQENDGANPYLQYIVDPNYWNIYNIRFELKGGSSDDHDRFWTILSEELSKL